jgi:predicted nucleic acid-binding protein
VTRYLDLKGARRLTQLYQGLVDGWQRCDLTFDDWTEAARLWAERHRLGRSVSDFDLLLAVLARKQEAILVTSNTRHFEGLGIPLQDWTSPVESVEGR